MLIYAIVFLAVALVAGLFGFGGIASASSGAAKVIFTVFLALFMASLVLGAVRGA